MSTTAVSSAAVQKQLKQGKVKKGIFSVIRHLVLALLAFIWLVPIAWLLLTSFSTDKGINFTRFVPEGFTLWNYTSIMTEPDSVAQFPRWFMNTLVVACFNCVISTCFVLMVAYAISCCRFKGRKLLQNLSVTVNLFPGVLAMIAVYFVLKYMNLTNSYAGLIMVYAGSSGLGYLICKGFFDTVPVALREAAKLDGASEARIFFQIVIPMSRPILVYTIINSFLTPVDRLCYGKDDPELRCQRGLDGCHRPVQHAAKGSDQQLLLPFLRGRCAGRHPHLRPLCHHAEILRRGYHLRRCQGLNLA